MKQIKDLRARYNANGNAIIPNTFQHPNIFVDRLMSYLTPVENTVLTFAVRRILGFQDNIMSRKDNISLSQFTDGIEAQNGTILSNGCGIGPGTVLKALEALERYRILLPTTDKPDPKRGQEYWLQDNEHAIDWDGLEQRLEEKTDLERRRTQKARYSVAQKSSVAQRATPSVGQNPSPLSDRDTKPTETHGNPKYGANAPLDWKIAHDLPITESDLGPDGKYKDAANLIATGMGMLAAPAYELAYAFMTARKIIIPNGKIKGQRKPVAEMIEMGVRPEHIVEAVRKLLEANLTVTDLYSVAKTAADLANKTPEDNGYNPQRLEINV